MFGRRASNASQYTDGGGGSHTGGVSVTRSNLGYGDGNSVASSSSDWPDDASDKESLQSWAKEQNEKEEEEDDLFAAKEEKNSKRWFVSITIALITVGVGVCVFTYYYLIRQEQNTFESSFENTAQSISDGADFHLQVIGQALQSRSQALTTFAAFTGSLWPFVSLPDFAIQGRSFMMETDTEMVAWAPLVIGDSNLRAWEAYSTYMLENSGWFPSIESEERLKTQLDRLEEQAEQTTGNEEGGLYVPLWQIAPAIYNQWITRNLTQQFEESIELLLQTRQPVWSRFLDMNEPFKSGEADNQNNKTDMVSSLPPRGVVSSLLFQPVFRSLASHDVSYGTIKNFTAAQEEVVGIFITALHWDTFLAGLVPAGTPGIDVVLRNQWEETLTYQVSCSKDANITNKAILIGIGDQHSSEYSDMSQSANLTAQTEQETLVEDALPAPSSLRGRHPHTEEELIAAGYNVTVDLLGQQEPPQQNENGTSFQMTMYPTTNFEEAYTSIEPMVIAIVLAALVLLVISVFFWYTRSIHNRQQKLVETANRTALVVKSLFPSNVRDRIMKEAEENEQNKKAKQKRKKYKDARMDESTSHRNAGDRPAGGGNLIGGNSILGGISIASVGSRYSRRGSSRGSRRGSADHKSQFGTNNSVETDNPYGSKPIADHFSETTVLFADMVGFTAWSSVREPTAVFTLLETVYHAFDKVARKRGIFKVETIGDCYVAVCGLPVPRPDHAIAMSYFATDCLRKMNNVTRKMEVTLGPDTGDLAMRIGLHSGPVTAGVLRGEKSRFQIFGDSVNTAARMESNGKRDCIHVSEATAKLLMDAGKNKWLTQREDKIVAKGKGEMQTYWVEVRSLHSTTENIGLLNRNSMDAGTTDDDDGSSLGESSVDFDPFWEPGVSPSSKTPVLGERFQRLVDWNVDQLVNLLKKIVAKREEYEAEKDDKGAPKDTTNAADFDLRTDTSIADELTEIISFPKPSIADIIVGDIKSRCSKVKLDSEVVAQLHELMTTIATVYNDNPFHSFAHASHVAMALTTWLSHIMPPPADPEIENVYDVNLSGDWTKSSPSKDMFALQSDPLTHFALVFAALILDVDHTGVPNSQLVKEQSQVAILYNGKCIHEQESVDSAFETLMDDRYSKLRSTIFATEDEFYRFRQIVINSVLATDRFDEKIMGKQSVRWGCLFRDQDDDVSLDYEPENEGDQKASVVVERLLLMSDISHYMQHWYVYRKWNEKLFEEHYLAWRAGRADADPSLTWYEGELEFFDTFAIPLASKMKDCELFDSSCGESLSYAKSNREQWMNTGQGEVELLLDKLQEIEFEVEDTFDPVSDGKVYSPSNGRPKPQLRPKDWQK